MSDCGRYEILAPFVSVTDALSALISPEMTFRSVDFPEPFAPARAALVLSFIVKPIFLSIVRSPKLSDASCI